LIDLIPTFRQTDRAMRGAAVDEALAIATALPKYLLLVGFLLADRFGSG
jgi:hypothetical protein